jgi:hypothetical protein
LIILVHTAYNQCINDMAKWSYSSMIKERLNSDGQQSQQSQQNISIPFVYTCHVNTNSR